MKKKYTFVVIYNSASGAQLSLADFKKQLYDLYPWKKYPSKILEIQPGISLADDLKKVVEECDNFVICGGDGTVRETIQLLADFPDITLTIIPLGTFNHFAQDIGQSMVVSEALQAIMKKEVMKVDLGQVNDLYFTNLSTLGLYTHIAKQKQKLRKNGVSRWIATCIATFRALRKFSFVDVTVKIDGKTIKRKSPLVVVGNNRYELQKESIGSRKHLNRHRLHFFVLKPVNFFRAFSLVFHSLAGTLKRQDEFDEFFSGEVVLNSSRKSTVVSLDGEVYSLDFPLKYKILPNKLRLKIFSPEK